jgi:histidine triad (HIT) family protein
MSKCVFCSIAAGTEKASFVYRSDEIVAFLDTRPVFKGHVLVTPTEHIGTLGDLAAEEVPRLFDVVRLLSGAVERGLGADGTFVAINNKISQSVPHLHVHVVPRRKGDGLKGFFWPRTKYESDEEQDDCAKKIAGAL